MYHITTRLPAETLIIPWRVPYVGQEPILQGERVKTLIGQPKKKAVFYCTSIDIPSAYRTRRALRIAQSLIDIEVIFLSERPLPHIEEAGFPVVRVRGKEGLKNAVEELRPDILLRDVRSEPDEVSGLRQVVPAMIHFDDEGEGGSAADLVFRTFGMETRGPVPSNVVTGKAGFIAEQSLLQYRRIGLDKRPPGDLPHIVIAHGPRDPANLSHRTLRHLTQLHIPLKVTVLLGEGYTHPDDPLMMMALGRRNVAIRKMPYDYGKELASADIVICSSGHIPYDVAFLSLPCIVLAQDEDELGHALPNEDNGFIPLGLGRKVKQSMLLNAVMELLLHEPRRKRAVDRLAALNVEDGLDMVKEAVHYYLEYPPRKESGRR